MSPAQIVPALFVILWATGFIGARYAMPWAEPFWFLTVRFLLTLAILLPLAALWRSRALRAGQVFHAMIAGALMHGVYLGGVFWAIDHGMPAGLSALIIGLQPLITAVLAGVFLGEAILPRHWAGLGIGFAGVMMVLGPKLGAIENSVPPAALVACVIAVLGMSAGTVWQKRHVAEADLVTGTVWQYVGGLALALPVAAFTETGRYVLTGELVFAMAWLVLVLSVGAIFLLMYLIREGEIARVASLFYLVPAVTAVIAYVLFGESLSLFQIFGMGVTTAGVALATVRRRPAPLLP